ncbi:glycine cleavage system protein GcvH [Dactylosporangium matsuzakiense]|uniref:Glycine cleavage system H protein n=1 Tax=Dactylosporangium matsuzakiense TaxID=53360 RepID=A0A9W6KQM7_9ACTN|nr:glycine cleavage system protein GcvH [Dactylosporangium matsuzakiense]UWZ42021.1 glycine cleavage system protein GcvH [Dactylosporangium matsuzakiense]GLL04894.1 glycine cleavage system H protein [Dactylosporangium matsuzakiense]
MIPDDLRYTAEHEWLAPAGDGTFRVGITHYAQDSLGDIVFVQLPEAGAAFEAGGALGEVESTKSVSEIYAPVAGEIVAVNPALEGSPELINSDPYGEGWLVALKPTDPAAVDALLDAKAYGALTAG